MNRFIPQGVSERASARRRRREARRQMLALISLPGRSYADVVAHPFPFWGQAKPAPFNSRLDAILDKVGRIRFVQDAKHRASAKLPDDALPISGRQLRPSWSPLSDREGAELFEAGMQSLTAAPTQAGQQSPGSASPSSDTGPNRESAPPSEPRQESPPSLLETGRR